MNIPKDKILYAYANLSSKDAAEYLGIGVSTYYNKLKELGIVLTKATKKVSDDEIIDAFNSSNNIGEAAAKVGINHSGYNKRIKKLGLDFKSKKDLRRNTVNDAAFSCINEVVAYWLGYLAADGSIVGNRLQFHASEKDIDIIENARLFLRTNANLCKHLAKYDYKGEKSSESVGFNVTSKQIVNDLAKYGIIQNKTYKDIDFISFISDKYKTCFIVGIFDGDGCITSTQKGTRVQYTINIVGNKTNMESIHKYLLEIGINNKLYDRGNLYHINIYSKESLLRFTDIYINQCNFNSVLKRKLTKVTECIKYFSCEKPNNVVAKVENTKVKTCKICGKTITAKAKTGMCLSCANVAAKGKSPKPSKEELQALINQGLQIKQIAKKYGRNSSTVSYWVKSYGLI